MSRRNGRRLDRRNHAPRAVGNAARAAFALLFSGTDSWFDADSMSGSDMVDYRDPTHKMVLTVGTQAPPAADVIFANAKSLVFTGTQRMVSNRAPSAWTSESSGSGSTRILIFAPTNVGITQLFVSTATTGATGAGLYGSASIIGSSATNGASVVFNANGGSLLAANACTAATFLFATANTPDYDFRVNGASRVTGDATAPDAGAPGGSLTFGSDASGANPAQMRLRSFADFKRVLNPTELAVAANYYLLSCGAVL